jgi:hypothetical protein
MTLPGGQEKGQDPGNDGNTRRIAKIPDAVQERAVLFYVPGKKARQ